MRKHPSRRFVIFVSLPILASGLGAAFTQTSVAQRASQNRQVNVTRKPVNATLKTVTLSGKGGHRNAKPRTGMRPRPLTRAQKLTLYKGRQVINSFTLSPDKPVYADKAWLEFVRAISVYTRPGDSYSQLRGSSNSTTNFVVLGAKAKVGKLYALDFSVYGGYGGTFTISNGIDGSAQSMPTDGAPQHLTAYVTAEDDYLRFTLWCTSDVWEFYSVEVTEL